MKKILTITLILSFLTSRLFFLNSGPVFFDSPEYLARLSNPNYFQALYSGHITLHPGYILIFWPIYHFGKIIGANPAYLILVSQVFLSLLTVYFFYKFLIIIFNKIVSLLSIIILSLIPIFWIVNISIMMESTYLAFFIFSLYFLSKFSSEKKSKVYNLLLSALFFGLSFFTHKIVIIWLPFLIYTAYFIDKNKAKKAVIYLIISLLVFSTVNSFLISTQLKTNLLDGVLIFYNDKLNDHPSGLPFTLRYMAIYLRNFIIPLLRNNSNLVVLLSFLTLFQFLKNKKLLFLFLLWILPAFIANQPWDSLFFGRHALITTFGLSILTAYFLQNRKKTTAIVIIYLLLISLPAVFLMKKNIPYLDEENAVKNLPKNGLLIESHFARPQIDGQYKGKIIFVDEPSTWNKEKLPGEIRNALKENKPVFVSSQALSEPYGLYSGPYIHSLSLSYKNEYLLKPIIEKFTLEEYQKISKKDNLSIYIIKQDKPSSYPKIQKLDESSRRLDFYDPLTQLWFFLLETSRIPRFLNRG